MHKPRDRSHYERFAAYHESFYRFVEATSLTPFSGPALDRGLAGHARRDDAPRRPELAPPSAAMKIRDDRELGEEAARRIAERGGQHGTRRTPSTRSSSSTLRARAQNLLDAWAAAGREGAARGGRIAPTRGSTGTRPRASRSSSRPIDEAPAPGPTRRKFAAPTSMRDVEPSVHLWLERGRSEAKR